MPTPIRPPKVKQESDDEEGGGDGFATVVKGGKSVQYTAEIVLKTLAQVNENRGKKVINHNISFHSPPISLSS